MKRSRRLERALDALARERKTVQRDLAEVTARRTHVTRAISRLENCRDTVAETPVTKDGRLEADVYLVARDAEARLLRELETLKSRLERFDNEVTIPVQDRLHAAVVRERAMNTLIQRRRTAEEEENARRERKSMDDHALQRWHRTKAPE